MRKRVRVLAAAGASDDEIARVYFLRPSELRERFGEELKRGRSGRKPLCPGKAHKTAWTELPRSRTAMAAQIAWLRAQVRGALPSVAAAATQERHRQKSTTDSKHLADWRNGNKESLYTLSDEALEDMIREGRAERAARDEEAGVWHCRRAKRERD
jgi:hypothetical protein